MTGGAVLKAALGGLTRRRLQTVVVFAVLTMVTAAGLLALTLATSSNESFQIAFARYHSADLAVTVNSAEVTSAQLARTRHLPGVTGAVGYPATTISLTIPVPADMAASGQVSGTVTVVGRASRSGPLDDLVQKTGRWPDREGEIDLALFSQTRGSVGQVVTATATNVRGKPKLTVVGYAGSVVQDETEDSWVPPGELTALVKAGAPAQEEMLYTFSRASTPAQISADLSELRAALPAGAIISYVSWLNTLYLHASQSGTSAPFADAYALIGLVLAGMIIASIVAAAVAASYRRIGVLKSIGFTPAQVVASYLAQLGIPAAAGSVAGTALGNRWVDPFVDTGPYNMTVGVPLWVNIVVPAGVLALTGLAALAPALRAGRLAAVAAIDAGQAPRARLGFTAHRLTGSLPLPRPVTTGLAAPFTRPARSAAVLATITFGLTAAVLAVGLHSSLTGIVLSLGHGIEDAALVLRLTALVIVLAGLGVFTSVLMLVRERARDLGVFKALGMTPRQIIAMVACWIAAPAIVATVIALPVGTVLDAKIEQAVVSAQAGPLSKAAGPGTADSAPGAGGSLHHVSRARGGIVQSPRGANAAQPPRGANPGPGIASPSGHVYTAAELALLALAGLTIALAGALGPAAWAATSRTTTALHAE